MNEPRGTSRLTFTIRTLLIITSLVALHAGVPFLARAFFATVVAAIILNLVSVVPMAAVHAIWKLANRGQQNHSSDPVAWVGKVYIGILTLVYVSVAIAALV